MISRQASVSSAMHNQPDFSRNSVLSTPEGSAMLIQYSR